MIDTAHLFGWRVAHFRTAQNRRGVWMTPVGADGKGFPDLCLVKPGRIAFMELKVNYRQLTPEQKKWRDEIILSGAEWYLITEKEWNAGLVEEILKPSQVSVRSASMGDDAA